MKERPIIFSSDEVSAILDEGRKTQTRRIVKPQPKPFTAIKGAWQLGENDFSTDVDNVCQHILEEYDSPYGFAYADGTADRLWVRETFQVTTWLHPSDENYGIIYRASENGKDWEENDEEFTWRSPIFMPRSASRITLEITDVRVERLQEITEEDARAEGLNGFLGHVNNREYVREKVSPKAEFRMLWDKVNGKRASWESNPFVWVIKFRVLTGEQQ